MATATAERPKTDSKTNGKTNGSGPANESVSPDLNTENGAQPQAGERAVNIGEPRYPIHPDVLKLGIPTQTSREYEELRDDIAQRLRDGKKPLLFPIILSKHPETKQPHMVDGLHRQTICDELAIDPEAISMLRWVKWDEAADVAMSTNKRRNLTDAQRVALAVNYSELLAEQAKARQAEAARATTATRQAAQLTEAAKEAAVVTVPVARLLPGGDILNSVSTQDIVTKKVEDLSRVKASFEHDGRQYVAVAGKAGVRLEAVPLMTVEEYKATGRPLTNYPTRERDWKNGARSEGYDGIIVTLPDNGGSMVLSRPHVIFEADQPQEVAAPAAERDSNKTRTSQQAADAVGGDVSASTVDRAAVVKRNDKAAWERIQKGENAPGTNKKETVNSAWKRLRDQGAIGEDGKKPQAPGLPNPRDYTPEDFVKATKLYLENPEIRKNKAYLAAVRTWVWMQPSINNLLKNAQKAGVLASPHDDILTRRLRLTAEVPHPNKWLACPTCRATGSVTAGEGNEAKTGACPKCFGGGYMIPRPQAAEAKPAAAKPAAAKPATKATPAPAASATETASTETPATG